MLFDEGVRLFLIGLSATSVVSFFAALGTQSRPKQFTLPLHAVIISIYVPLLAIAVNELPPGFIGPLSAAWLILILMVAATVTLHTLVAVWHRLTLVSQLALTPNECGPVDILAREPPKGSLPGYVLVNSSVAKYRDTVSYEEERGRDFSYIQRRIAPYLYSDEMLQFIAKQRFGAGNPEMGAYVTAHQRRRQSFFLSLESGARYRELFLRQTLIRYVQTGTHADDMWPLPPSTVIDLLKNWRQALLRYPNYYVGISDHSLPIKYHLIDGECVILHEPVGKGDDIRLNSFFIYGRDIGAQVASDFDLVWGLIDPEWRDRKRIARWIIDELIPLARRRPK